MKQSLDELLAVVYRFYAREVGQYAPGYKETEQHCRLVQARIQAGVEGNRWEVLWERLSGRLPKDKLQYGSLHLPTGGMDACYIGLFWLPARGSWEKNHVIGFLTSFLVPCYVVYSSAFLALPWVGEKPRWRQEISFTFTPDEQSSVQIITEEIQTVFPGYEPMPPEIGNVIVPDVVAGNQALGKTTLYHCLFTDDW
jgi:hypothetical protein